MQSIPGVDPFPPITSGSFREGQYQIVVRESVASMIMRFPGVANGDRVFQSQTGTTDNLKNA
jgi:hypothetical protein